MWKWNDKAPSSMSTTPSLITPIISSREHKTTVLLCDCFWDSGVEHWGSSRDCFRPFPVYFVHIRFKIKISRVLAGWTGDGVQGPFLGPLLKVGTGSSSTTPRLIRWCWTSRGKAASQKVCIQGDAVTNNLKYFGVFLFAAGHFSYGYEWRIFKYPLSIYLESIAVSVVTMYKRGKWSEPHSWSLEHPCCFSLSLIYIL